MSSTSLHAPKSTTTIYGHERGPDISTPAQAFATPRPQSIDHPPGGEEDYPGIVVPSKASPTTPRLHSLRDKDARSMEDNRASVSRNQGYHNNPIQTALLVTPEQPSIGRGDGAVQSKEAGHGVDPAFSVPLKGAPTIAAGLYPLDRGDRVVQLGVPSTSFFQGSSNVEITSSTFYEIHGNTTINRFSDGQFTDDQRNLISEYIANLSVVLPDINNLRQHVLTQSIISLPRAKAMFDDYQNKKKSGPCFKGTREALLREMADWVTTSTESRMYILSGLAGIGKSTVAYTIASRAADLNLLGASFFFSRDEADRKNAEFFFSTIAYQLCVYNETFARVIGDVLLTKRGSVATTKDSHDQLQALILEPLRSIVHSHSRPILIVVDALDECDEEEAFSVLTGLSQLIRDLPPFKIILTTRPQPYLNDFLISRDRHKIFRLQDIEDKIVDSDVRLYLNYSLSLEQVQKHYPKRQWHVSDEEIESLVRAVGRLFIIASTAVRYILDKSASNPADQMQKLLLASAQDHTPFKDLNHFYTVILRSVISENCDNDNTVSRYQLIIGVIICVQRPLPVSALAHLIDANVVEIYEVLDSLQSVILLGSDDIPRVYHKSFPDYLIDQMRCNDPRLQINTKIHHAKIATRCFEIMDKHLRLNILGLSEQARFMSNDDGLKADGITDEQIQEKIPQQLRYACVYWANHLEVVNMEDEVLMNGLERFAHEHMLYWLEVLSLIGNLDSAHRAIDVVLKLLTSTPSDLHQLLSDALRFITKFYETINRSALHTYYSALSFAPTDSLLYHRYIHDAAHNICRIEGGPEKWDALVANLRHGPLVEVIKFSLDSTLLVSCSRGYVDSDICEQAKLKIWDAVTGTPISMIPGHRFAVANDVSTVVSSHDNIATLYNVNGNPGGTMFTTSSKIEKLALSSESNRVAAALSDRTVWLWDSRNDVLIGRFDDFGDIEPYHLPLEFSSTGTRLAYFSANGIKLRDGISGRLIADLQCGPSPLIDFQLSGDGSRIASVSYSPDDSHLAPGDLRLWNSESGGLIASIRGLCWRSNRHIRCRPVAISANGSFLAIADRDCKLALYSGSLTRIKVLEGHRGGSMAFSLDNILAIATYSAVQLYNVNTHSVIHTFLLDGARFPLPAFSPDCTRLAVWDRNDNVNLWDIRGINAPGPPSRGNPAAVTVLTLSRDCSQLACGFVGGTIELWGTSSTNFTNRRIDLLAPRSKMEKNFVRFFRHTTSVQALGFNPDGELFASGSYDGAIALWNSGDGVLRGTLKVPGGLQAIVLSNGVLVAAWSTWYDDQHDLRDGGVTLWRLDTLGPIHTFKKSDDKASRVSIAENNTLIAVCLRLSHVTLFDVVNRTTIGSFGVPSCIDTMTFLPDNSQLVVQSDEGMFRSFNLINNLTTEGPTLGNLVQLPNTPLWHGVPVWHCKDKEQHYFAALFSQHKSPVPVLWIPKQIPVTAWAQGSSMIALGFEDGRVILLRLRTS